jgi:hypothetical protein
VLVEESVELRLAVGAVQADGLALPRCDGRLPQPYEMPLTSQGGSGRGLRALPLSGLGLRCPLRNGEHELNQELHDLLLREVVPGLVELQVAVPRLSPAVR